MLKYDNILAVGMAGGSKARVAGSNTIYGKLSSCRHPHTISLSTYNKIETIFYWAVIKYATRVVSCISHNSVFRFRLARRGAPYPYFLLIKLINLKFMKIDCRFLITRLLVAKRLQNSEC